MMKGLVVIGLLFFHFSLQAQNAPVGCPMESMSDVATKLAARNSQLDKLSKLVDAYNKEKSNTPQNVTKVNEIYKLCNEESHKYQQIEGDWKNAQQNAIANGCDATLPALVPPRQRRGFSGPQCR